MTIEEIRRAVMKQPKAEKPNEVSRFPEMARAKAIIRRQKMNGGQDFVISSSKPEGFERDIIDGWD